MIEEADIIEILNCEVVFAFIRFFFLKMSPIFVQQSGTNKWLCVSECFVCVCVSKKVLGKVGG